MEELSTGHLYTFHQGNQFELYAAHLNIGTLRISLLLPPMIQTKDKGSSHK